MFAVFPSETIFMCLNYRFLAGPAWPALVKIPKHGSSQNAVAPKTRSSRPGCIQEGRLTGTATSAGSLHVAIHQKCFDWQKPCHFNTFSNKCSLWCLTTRIMDFGHFVGVSICPPPTPDVCCYHLTMLRLTS